jgi:adenosine deaminase
MMFEMARRNGVTLPYATVEETRAAYAFTNLQTFLDIYYAGAAALRQEQDFYELAMAYFRRAKADGVVHAEIFFDPQTHTARGIAFETVLNGLERAASDAKAELGVSSRLLLCFLRHLPEADAFATLAQARPHLQRIHGVGLDSSEKGHPPAKFQRVFAQCRELGLHLVAHAGEEGPAANVRDSLDLLKTERIDHGVRAIEDPALLARLVREQIPLTVCPLSNIKLRVFPSMEQHNLKQLLDLGLRVTLNSDDPAYFGGYIGQNFLATAQALKLSRNELVTLARNSLLASFVTAAERAPWLAQLEKVASA